MALERIRETFNDGLLQFGHNETLRSPTLKRIGERFVPEGNLFFRQLSVRTDDYLQFGAMGKTLDLKVKTHLPPSLKPFDSESTIVRIIEDDYQVITFDRDSHYLYLYLHKVGGDGGGSQSVAGQAESNID